MKMVLFIYLLFFCLFLYLWLQVILNAVHFIFPLLVTHTKGGGDRASSARPKKWEGFNSEIKYVLSL
jgi:hypothetical protein